MGLVHIFEKGDDVRQFEEKLHMAKDAIMDLSDQFEEMKMQFSQRGGYSNRGGYSGREGGGYSGREGGGYSGREGGYSNRDGGFREEYDYEERRGRDSMGRYTRR